MVKPPSMRKSSPSGSRATKMRRSLCERSRTDAVSAVDQCFSSGYLAQTPRLSSASIARAVGQVSIVKGIAPALRCNAILPTGSAWPLPMLRYSYGSTGKCVCSRWIISLRTDIKIDSYEQQGKLNSTCRLTVISRQRTARVGLRISENARHDSSRETNLAETQSSSSSE